MNRKIVLLISCFFFFLVAMLLFFTDFNSYRDFPEIKKKGILRVVMLKSPFTYNKDNDTIRGFQYELVKHFADSMGLKLKVSGENSLNESIDGLEKGQYDIIARNILITSELRDKVDFTRPILQNRQVLVQRSDSNVIRNQLDLAGKTLHVTKNSPYMLRIKNLAEEIGDTIYMVEHDKLSSSSQLLYMVSNGDIDYAVYDERSAHLYKISNLDLETPVGFTQIGAWAFRKESPGLEKALDDFLESFLQTEAYQKIYDKYYGAF